VWSVGARRRPEAVTAADLGVRRQAVKDGLTHLLRLGGAERGAWLDRREPGNPFVRQVIGEFVLSAPGRDCPSVRTVVRRESKRSVRPESWQPGPGRLTVADREEISLGLRDGDSFTAIAVRLGKAVSTVSREVADNGGRDDYRAWRAHQRARECARRPKTPKPGSRLRSHAVAARVVVSPGDRQPVADGVTLLVLVAIGVALAILGR
jgi:helix-turn-helix protein